MKLLKQIYGFDPGVFISGVAIKIEDSHVLPQRGRFLNIEFPNDYFRENLTGNYLVKYCYVTELHLTNTFGKEYIVPLKHINGDNPRMKITIIG